MYYIIVEAIKQKRSTMIHVAYDNDRQLKLVRDTMEQFGMEFEVLGDKESYDGKIAAAPAVILRGGGESTGKLVRFARKVTRNPG